MFEGEVCGRGRGEGGNKDVYLVGDVLKLDCPGNDFTEAFLGLLPAGPLDGGGDSSSSRFYSHPGLAHAGADVDEHSILR